MNALDSCGFVSGSVIRFRKEYFGSDLKMRKLDGTTGVWSKGSRDGGVGRLRVMGRIKKGQKHEYPWPSVIDPNWESGHLKHLSQFKPLTVKPKPVTLEFEKPLVQLEKKIIDVRKMADETGLDFSDQISQLESKYQQALKDLYTHLTPIQRVSIARHPNRPTFLDHVFNITEKWIELHGDRAGYDDPAIVTGLGSINGKSYMFIGQQKGRNTKENIQRNFGMPTPHGYRKALRMMRYADHHGFPIITMIDTPGAFADLKSEELGQGEAIAFNLRAMFGLKVPVVTVVIGEGGSGGALAIGCANKLFMMENAVFYVASPEACAAILWKSSKAAPRAAEKLKITSTELCKLKIADGIIPEPLGGAHTDPTWTSQQIKLTVTKAMEELGELDTDGLLRHRHLKFRALGGFVEGGFVEPEKKRNMKKKDADIAQVTADIESEIERLKKATKEAKGKSSGPNISDEAIEKLKKEVDKEMTNAYISMGLQDELQAIKIELSKSKSPETVSPELKQRVDTLVEQFNKKLSQPGAFIELKHKLELLADLDRLREQRTDTDKRERFKREINEKLQEKVRGKMGILKRAREKVANGEQLSEDLIKEVSIVKEELKELLQSANLDVVGLAKKDLPAAPPQLEEKLIKADEVIKSEIENVIDKSGLRGKLEELKEEFGRGADKEELEKLASEIREGILSHLDSTELKKKVQSSVELPEREASISGNDQAVGADKDMARTNT